MLETFECRARARCDRSGRTESIGRTRDPTHPLPRRDQFAAVARLERLMGDVAPKLVELTDNVLFGDVRGVRS